MSEKLKKFLIYLLVAICSAIVSYFGVSCSSVWIKGSDNNPVIHHTPTVTADSTSFVKVGS